ARCTWATSPKVTACSSGTPDLEVTWAEISTMWATTTTTNRNVLPRRRSSRIAMVQSPTVRAGLVEARTTGELVNRDLPQQVEIREQLARAEHDRRERIFGHGQRQACLLTQALVQVLEQRAAARQDDPAVHDVGERLGRRALQRHAHGIHDHAHGLGQRFADFLVRDGDGLRHALDQVPALDLHRHALLERIRGPDLHLDSRGRALADEQVVRLLDVLDDRLVHLVARDAHRLAVDDARERDDGDVGGAAADVHDHVARGLRDRHARTDRRGHGFFHQVHLAGLRAIRAVLHRALFDLRDLRRDADHDTRPDPDVAVVVRLADEVRQHLLGDLEVGNDAVLHRLDGAAVGGGAAAPLPGVPGA